MHKTKKRIFEIAMELFAKKGYESASIEEITAVVGIAKGTFYYHFNSKEEIFNFLVEEGISLLINSILIKADKAKTMEEKLKAVMVVQIKVISKYENFIRMVATEMWGNEPRNVHCRKQLYKYIDNIEEIVKEGVKKGEIREGNTKIIATEIFGLLSGSLIHKIRNDESVDFNELKKEYEKLALKYIISGETV